MKFPKKFELPDKRRFNMETRADSSLPPGPTRICKFSMMSMACYVSIGQLGYLSGYAPSQLLHTCSLAEYEKLEKST